MGLPDRKSRRTAAVFLGFVLGCSAAQQQPPPIIERKEKEPETQVLQLPKELPATVVGETWRLSFHVTPLSAKGLLTRQVRDALNALGRATRNASVLRIRAYVAGSGDLRRVRDLISDHYAGRRQPLPAATVVRVGGLPLTGAQVVLEAIASQRKDVNPHGVAFLSPQAATSDNQLDPILPLTVKTLAALRGAVKSAGVEPAGVLRVTCYFSSLDNVSASRSLIQAEYPRAALNYVQTQRAPGRALAACEAVGRLRSDPGVRLSMLDAEGSAIEPGQSPIVILSSRRAILTSAQSSFGTGEQDSRLAFERMRAAIEQAGASLKDVASANCYYLNNAVGEQVRRLRQEYFDPVHPPNGVFLPFEGLPSMDAGFAIDVIAARD